jgi:hypothetical protein
MFPTKYAEYVANCLADRVKPLSYIAWAHLQPLAETEL